MNQTITPITSLDGFPRLSLAGFHEQFPDASVGQRRNPQPERCIDSTSGDERLIDGDDVRLLLITGNVSIDEAFLLGAPRDGWSHIAVDGDLHIAGRTSCEDYDSGMNRVYFVSGDLYVGSVNLTNMPSNTVAGHIVAHCAWLSADDDCAMRTAPELRVHARFLFAWFYSIDDLTICPDAVIFILGNGKYCADLRLPNPSFQWHEDIHVLDEPFVYIVQREGSDAPGWVAGAIEAALARGESIFRDGFDIACYPYHRAAQAQADADDQRAAYLLHKKTAAIAPGFYEAWLGMGDALFQVGAYRQARAAYRTAATLFPADQTGLVNLAFNYASLCALYLDQFDEAIAMANMSVAHNRDAEYENDTFGYAYRCRAEAYLLAGRVEQAFADLEEALRLDPHDSATQWLMGLVYHQRGDGEQARLFHAKASRYQTCFSAFYDVETGTAFLYDAPTEVDWDAVSLDTVRLPAGDEGC
ncbi:tetratricopeptide repeat protein [Massilia antarctica]|uniref:Tetratricopeptide repeat protein n=1 Tax=Massilia antarctica TaxID=2765360 RepID=A0AA48WAG6_9BURK|nr:tetratricopeptide repeat protein [Massilia antarctica]QPI48103.1 tetratricopeptide repeat protein [Massilia antarctica]